MFGPHNVSKNFIFSPHKYRFLDSIEKMGRIWFDNNQQELSSWYSFTQSVDFLCVLVWTGLTLHIYVSYLFPVLCLSLFHELKQNSWFCVGKYLLSALPLGSTRGRHWPLQYPVTHPFCLIIHKGLPCCWRLLTC